MTTDLPKASKLGRWQFSLRTLLVAVAVLGIGFGWLGMKLNTVRQQRRAAVEIGKLGGSVRFEGDFSPNVVKVYLHNTQVTDAGLKELAGLTQLQTLYLTGTKVTDAGLKELAGLTRLQWLNLQGTKVTDEGLKELAGLKQLHMLFLDGTQVTDAGVQELQKALPKVLISR